MARQLHGEEVTSQFGIEGIIDDDGLPGLLKWVERTWNLHPGASPVLPLGYFANVIPIGAGEGIAISTDGVGTKILIAQAVGRYDTIGIDCVAMNVNDVLCVGATPLSMVDYIAVEEPRRDLLEDLARGLSRGCEMASINIPGGEVAHLSEILRGCRPGYAFDVAGTCIGKVRIDNVIAGDSVEAGDVVLGLASGGLHSNGYTLARKVFNERSHLGYEARVAELGSTLGEELLRPTRIYVAEILALLDSGIDIRALAHITGGGIWNLVRTRKAVGFRIDSWPAIPPIFRLIQRMGNICDAEAFSVFNMGIGFCVVVPPADVAQAEAVLRQFGTGVHVLGEATDDESRSIAFPSLGLVGRRGSFERSQRGSSEVS